MNKYTINQFRADYPNNDACLDKIFQLRYTNLVCPKCEGTKPFTPVKDRRAYQCPACAFQLYPTQGTIFEKTTTPLTHWFYAIYLQTTTRNGVAAKELERQLNVCYKTALRMNHQIKILMSNKTVSPFTGVIQMDESFIGGLNKNRHDNGNHAYTHDSSKIYYNLRKVDSELYDRFTDTLAEYGNASIIKPAGRFLLLISLTFDRTKQEMVAMDFHNDINFVKDILKGRKDQYEKEKLLNAFYILSKTYDTEFNKFSLVEGDVKDKSK